jgi:hypothetical protein
MPFALEKGETELQRGKKVRDPDLSSRLALTTSPFLEGSKSESFNLLGNKNTLSQELFLKNPLSQRPCGISV